MENKQSFRNLGLLAAIKKGYVVDDDGNVFFRGRQLNLYQINGYHAFSIRLLVDGKSVSKYAMVHRLVAYLKYGDKIFEKGICVRHLNGDCKDNSKNNIGVGTQSENMMDKSADVRMKMAIKASSFAKKHNHEEILDLHNKGFSYGKIMKKLGISSKGTISFIIKQSIDSKKIAV